MPPKVSVVIPVYNRSVPVVRAIDSVLKQTYQDFEVIVVDDCSTDGTPQSVRQICDSRIRLVRHERNSGGSAARNTGIRASAAPYVAFLDSDDEWLPTKLARQVEVFEQSDGKVGLVYTGTTHHFADGSAEVHIPRIQGNLAHALLTKNVVGETSVGMVSRSALQKTGGFDESLPASQEMDLWLRICEQFTAVLIPEALVRVMKGDDKGRITANIPATTKGRELFRRKHGDQQRRRGVLHRYLRDSGWWYQRAARNSIEARRCYWESLEVNRTAPLTYVLLVAAYVPLSWLDCLANWKHQVSAFVKEQRWFRGGRDRSLPETVRSKEV